MKDLAPAKKTHKRKQYAFYQQILTLCSYEKKPIKKQVP